MVPRRWGGGDLELHLVHLLDLSALGARIAHREPLHAGGIGYLDLPPALARLRLTGRVAWTWLRRVEQTVEGERRSHYESGVEFTSLTPEQRAALVTVLATLQAAEATPDREPSA